MRVRDGIPGEDPLDSLGESLDSIKDNVRTAGDLASGISQDLSKLVRLEIELAKQEIAEIARTKAVGAGLVAVGGIFGLLLLPFMLLTLFEVLAVWMPRWTSALLVTILMAVTCAVLFLLARNRLEGNYKPEQTIGSLKDNLAWFKRLGRRHGRRP
jgi:hypothetical protein